ncbi:MAG: hypothetical protein V3V21_08225 [Thermoplasmata archaeon]
MVILSVASGAIASLSAVMSYLSMRAYKRYLSKKFLIVAIAFMLFFLQGLLVGVGTLAGIHYESLFAAGLVLEFVALLGIYASTLRR